MDAERILQDLNRRFAKPLLEFYKRRIVVWYDEDREFADKLDSIQVTGVKMNYAKFQDAPVKIK